MHIISDQVQDIDLAKYFHEMTGFSESKLKQKLAGLGKSEHNLITDQEPSYDKLLGIFKAIIDIIDKDKRSAILKKGKKKLIK